MSTITNRFRGRAGRRIAATIVAAAALGLGATACGPDSDAADSSGSSASSTASPSQEASSQPTGGSSSGNSGSQGQNGGESAAPGGGVANAGNHRTIVGTMEYLAPGKLIVKPKSGGMDQAFLVANATKILGAAAICTAPDGSVAIGDDGYGTAKCTVDELEKAAKTNSVTVRVTMDRKSGGAEVVEEKYHP
ncbi:hypothetical protein [Streptomyces yatensis]|uniref:Lipoprotein n=1 Tax=Streptomyces yatensis TaxID=155177 RepID=A0ABP4TGE6_9ACTN|nr:hypothetical protein [Streptomyces yatensis]